MTPRRVPKPRLTLRFAVNKLRIKVPMLFEIEGEGLIPAIGALVLGLIMLAIFVLR
jgi:hypothetical protein